MRPRGFGPGASRLAVARLKEAVNEVTREIRRDPRRAADGAVEVLARIGPAFEQVDSSSGALGTAVRHAIDALVPVLVAAAGAAPAAHVARLERLWLAVEDDGVGYLDALGDRWGELCADAVLAARWADRLRPPLEDAWAQRRAGTFVWFRGTLAALSCLLAASRYDELLALIEAAPTPSWTERQYGARALAAQGRIDDALAYAEASRTRYDPPDAIDAFCEEVLLAGGRADEAWRRYALAATGGANHLARFRALARKYPHLEPRAILDALIAASRGEEGRWFATARSLGLRAFALDLARRGPCEPQTLVRAARDHLADDPAFAREAALLALDATSLGWGYEVTAGDVFAARDLALAAGRALGQHDATAAQLRALVARDAHRSGFVHRLLGGHAG